MDVYGHQITWMNCNYLQLQVQLTDVCLKQVSLVVIDMIRYTARNETLAGYC